MLKKLFFLGMFGAIALTHPTDLYAADFAVIDQTCYKQMLDSLYVSKDDISKYKKVFRALKANNIAEAEDIADDIDNDILMGHVLAEKYLSKSYKSSFGELKSWLSKYNDHPQAIQIYTLAAKKGGKENLSDEWDKRGVINRTPYSWFNDTYANLASGDRAFVRLNVANFLKYINQGKTRAARNILENKRFRNVIPNRQWDAMSATLATVYFLDNQDQLTIDWTTKATQRSHDATAYWFRGLAQWRLGKYKDAGNSFSRLGGLSDNDEWLVSAGAYWAYRSYNKIGNKKEAQKWLNVASKYKRTFYGILANYQLGIPLKYNWDSLAYMNDFSNYNYVNDLVASPAISRAVILIHAKNMELAEKELRTNFKQMNDKQREVAVYIAQQYQMHPLGIFISNNIKNDDLDIFYDCVAYPTPDWEPKHGWKIDQALVWALVRQESAFHPKAQSGAGAKGLMQVLSSTAVYVTKDRRFGSDKTALFETEDNLETGQKYVSYLMEKPYIGDNLFFLATAYNAGPGNLYKWQKSTKYNDDPLMYIEAIPARQTRIYIERVLANFWIYNARFGKQSKSLEELVHDQWPTL